MNLYRVEVSYTAYVVAENEDDAEDVAQTIMWDDLSHSDLNYDVRGANNKWLEHNWKEALPWGTNDNKTCQQWLDDD